MSFIIKHYKEYSKNISSINYLIPKIQRYENEEHVKKLYEFEKLYYDKHGEYCISGNISIVINIITGLEYLVDGQHRTSTYKMLLNDYPDRELKISVDYYHIDNDIYLDRIYKIINSQLPNDISVLSIDKYKIINETCKYLITNFKDYHKFTSNPHKPNFNIENIKESFNSLNIIDKLQINNSKVLIDKIIELNKFYSTISWEKFKKWGINNAQSIIEKINNNSNKFYLGLYRNEWINILIHCSPDNYNNIDHYAEGNRIKITKSLRKLVWNNDSMKSKCYCCKKEISYDDFECGHIIPSIKGGETTLNNLKPICKTCNNDMGTENLEIYKSSLEKQLNI